MYTIVKWCIIICCFFPFTGIAQFRITGQVINLTTKKGVPKVTVFLSNATNGTATDEDGRFILTNVKRGQYDMVLTSIGYETYHVPVVINSDLTLNDIPLTQKSIELQAVTISSDPNRERYLAEFKREFLGMSEFARQCKITNLDIVNIRNDKKHNRLTANTDTYLDIVNEALGYRIKYYLDEFVRDRDSNMIFYQGSSAFEELKGSPRQMKRWAKNREDAYYGSSEHFLRACIGNNIESEGFRVLRLVEKPNIKRKPDSLIKARLQFFYHNPEPDSVSYWEKQSREPKVFRYLIKEPLNISVFARRTDQVGLYAFGIKDMLYIMYTKKGFDNAIAPTIYQDPGAPDYLTTIATFKNAYAFFDSNGIVTDPRDVVYDGFWTRNRIAEMLPVDYEPAPQ